MTEETKTRKPWGVGIKDRYGDVEHVPGVEMGVSHGTLVLSRFVDFNCRTERLVAKGRWVEATVIYEDEL